LKFVLSWIVAATLATASTPVEAQPAVPVAQKVSKDWKRLTSGDLQVVGNASEEDLRRALEQITAFRAVVQAVLPGVKVSTSRPTVICLFRDMDAFRKFAPRDAKGRPQETVAGYFSAEPDMNKLVLPIMDSSAATYRVALHEYTHHLVNTNLRHLPIWLNEGIADFYSTLELNKDGKAIIGRPVPWRMQTLNSTTIPPLRRLLSGASAEHLFKNPYDTAMFYAQSWAFVHYMTLGEGGKRRGQLTKYLELLQASKPYDEAAREAFGTDIDALDRAVRTYVQLFKMPALVFTGRMTGSSAIALQPVSEGEANVTQAELLLSLGQGDDANDYLKRALAVGNVDTRTRIALGRLRSLQDRFQDAVQELRAAVQDQPNDFTGHFYLAAALDRAEQYEDSLREYERALAIDGDSAAAWYGLSTVALFLGRDSQSDAAMRQVERFDAAATWHYTRVRAALAAGRNAVAARAARRTIELAGIADETSMYAAFAGVIANWRLEDVAESDRLLAEIAAATAPKSWVATVTQFLRGTITDSQFLAAAKGNGQRTEAHAYIGFKALRAGDLNTAKIHFTWVKEQGEHNYTEYGMALAELKRLG
jgi:tetratricopeptide (TPR) repeat protein